MANVDNSTRRTFLVETGVGALGLSALASGAWADDARSPANPGAATPVPGKPGSATPADAKPPAAGGSTAAPAATPPGTAGKAVQQSDLMAPNALPDVVQGDPSAPITMVEYASMTCPHCAHFHATTYPTLKSKYIDTKKVRFILREFPLDPLATAAFMLARCTGSDEKRTAMLGLIFDKQDVWMRSDKPGQALLDVVKPTGMTQQAFEKCLDDKKLFEGVGAIRDRGAEKFGVDATPTFFVNGKRVAGELNVQALDQLLQPMLKS